MRNFSDDTIVAVSTPSGIGGIAVVRVSGPQTVAAVSAVFRPYRPGHELRDRRTHTLTYGQIFYPETGQPLDDVVVALYRSPHSFTGEDVVEISCHGSQYIQQQLVLLLMGQKGVRLATGGEFTRRAFLNGKMDLSQAEAVADLIAAQNAAAHRMAHNQLKGTFSRKLAELRVQLVQLSSLLELELDFSEEDVQFADRSALLSLADEIHREVCHLASTFQTGQAIKQGVPIAIVGETNVGKSTLLNQLLGEERALVSDVHGTTRDSIEGTALVGGRLVRFIDTAGLRETQDRVEQMGIARTLSQVSKAQLILWMVDASRFGDDAALQVSASDASALYLQLQPYLSGHQEILVVVNKCDLMDEAALARRAHTFCQMLADIFAEAANEKDAPERETSGPKVVPSCVMMSAKTGRGVGDLVDCISGLLAQSEKPLGDIVVSNLRHYEALKATDAAIRSVQAGLKQGLSAELVSEDVREALQNLGLIVGMTTSSEILEEIFRHHCVGK